MPQTYSVGARSLFVTWTAWVFILLAALASASALVQNAAMTSLMPGFQPAGEGASASLPLLTGFLIGYLPWVVGTGLVMSLATLASAIGLLLRLDWARRAFIALLVVAIVANLMGLGDRAAVAPGLGPARIHRTAGGGDRRQPDRKSVV